MRLDALPELRHLAAAVRSEGEGDEGARHQVDHGGLSPVEGADDDLAHGQAQAVAGHRDGKIVGADIEAFVVVKAHGEAKKQARQHDVAEADESELRVRALGQDERHLRERHLSAARQIEGMRCSLQTPTSRRIDHASGKKWLAHQDFDGHVQPSSNGDHDILSKNGGGAKDPEYVIEECEDKERCSDH